MKKFSVLFLALLCNAFVFAQKQEHIDFKGISMGLSYEQFAQKLKATGCVFKEAWDADSYQKFNLYTGTFVGVKDCEIMVITSSNKEYINGVVVRFPKSYSTQVQFKKLKEAYIKKYGEESDGGEDQCVWILDNGFISIDYKTGFGLAVSYIDKKNNEGIEKDKEQRINNDI